MPGGEKTRFGIIVHGPEIIDTGRAKRLIEFFRGRGECDLCLGGAMGAIAVIDAEMEDTVDISRRARVSEAMIRLDKDCEAIVILNHCKTRESGMAFGALLAARVDLNHSAIQVDDGFVMPLNSLGGELAHEIALETGAELVTLPGPEGSKGLRTLHGVQEGEAIWVNGNVIGRARGPLATIRRDGNELVFEGVEIKGPGLSKALPFDLDTALIRSGSLRRTDAMPRSIPRRGDGSIMLVDHCAENSFFETGEASAAVTVGDDTTRIAGALLYRKGIPILGITDGDEDGICREGVVAPGSLIIRLRPGSDDQVGEELRRMVFGQGRFAFVRGGLGELSRMTIEMAGDRLLEVIRV